MPTTPLTSTTELTSRLHDEIRELNEAIQQELERATNPTIVLPTISFDNETPMPTNFNPTPAPPSADDTLADDLRRLADRFAVQDELERRRVEGRIAAEAWRARMIPPTRPDTPTPVAGRVTMTGRVISNDAAFQQAVVSGTQRRTANRAPAVAAYQYNPDHLPPCDHKFINTTYCVKCGAEIG